MPTLWYVTRDGRTMRGPFTSQILRVMASKGHILPTDTLRKERTLPAARVKGLFHTATDAPEVETSEPA